MHWSANIQEKFTADRKEGVKICIFLHHCYIARLLRFAYSRFKNALFSSVDAFNIAPLIADTLNTSKLKKTKESKESDVTN